MFKAISRSIAKRRGRRIDEYLAKEKEQEQHASLLSCSDERLARELESLVDRIELIELLYLGNMCGALATQEKLRIGLDIVKERVKADGLNQHPALAPIVREFAVIPPNDLWNSEKKVAAVRNATKENPRRALVDVPKGADHSAPNVE